nr:putative ribonuclease H-like domain-containing protein [Tanacetum cinerariifolium]
MYLTSSRPDIMFDVCTCARHQVTPKECHLHAVKRIFRYLKGNPKLGLWYPKESPFDLVAYSDSDYGGANQDRKSTTKGCQFWGRRLISWQCQKQTIVATSTTKTEYVAAASSCGKVLWIQNQLLDYGYNFVNTKIYIDNNSAICIVKNHVYHSKSKHIEIRHHFIRDCYEKKLINVDHIHTDEKVADLLTKYFDVGRFQYLVGGDTGNSGNRVETTYGETKILAQVNGRQRTIYASSIRRHLKLNDEECISTLPDDDLFEKLSLMGYNILPNQRFSFQKGQFSHQCKFLIHTILQCLSPKGPSFNEFSSNIATALMCLATNRTYNFSKMIFDGMMRNVKNETAFPTGDIRYGEAFPTDTSLDAGHDRENIAKTSAMPHEVLPRVTSLGGDETAFPTGDIRYGEAFPTDTSLDAGHDRENIAKTSAMPHEVLPRVTSLGGVATASISISLAVATASGSFPTAVIFTTTSVATPTTRVIRSSSGVVIRSSSLISANIPSISKKDKGKGKITKPEHPSTKKVLEQLNVQLARDLEAKFAQEDLIIREQAKRGSEIARIHEKMKDFVLMNSKIESERLKRPGIQLDKERIKKLKTAEASDQRKCWKIIRVGNHTEVYQIFKDMLKKFEREDLDKLWSLVKETCSTTEDSFAYKRSPYARVIEISKHQEIHLSPSFKDSLIIRDVDLCIIPKKESNKFIKSSVEDLVLILRESEDTFDGDKECDFPFCGNFVTFSNPLFDSNNDFPFSNDESLLEEDVQEENFKIYSNPLFEFDDKHISSDVNPLLNKDIKTKDSYVPNLDDPTLLVTPLSDANEDECFNPKGDIDEIDAFLDSDVSINIEDGYHHLEGDIIYLESLLINDNFPNLPPDVYLDHDPRILKDEPDNDNLKSMVKVFDLVIHEKIISPTYVRLLFKDRHYFSLTFVIRIFLPYLTYSMDSCLLLSSGSE